MTKREAIYIVFAIVIVGGIITSVFLLLPGGENFQEPTVLFEVGELQIGGDEFDLPVNITCLNASITLISASSNPCISLGIFNNESVDIIPFLIPVNETQTIFLRCAFQENSIYFIEFYFQLQGHEFTKIIKYEP